MIALGMIAAAAAVYFGITVSSARKRDFYVNSERPTLYLSAIHIICGDCSGDAPIPVKTFMNRHGACETCGGSSYILASHRGSYLRGLMAGLQMQQAAMAGGDGNVLPFEPRIRPALPGTQEKVAV